LQQIPNFIQMGKKEGMCSLNDSLLDLVGRDIVEPAEAYQRAIAKEEFVKRMGALPKCRSPKGQPWTEEELLQAAEGAEAGSPGNGSGNGTPQTVAERAAAVRIPELIVN
jgi:hypothetical protein